MKVTFTKEPKKYKFLKKSAMLSILVFSVGTSSVFASEMSTPTPSSTPASVSVTQNMTETTTSLLPGDFFYFVKTMYENIRLALTVNDVKEARLLAAFAKERLAEANALLAKGKTDEASLTLQKSLEIQQNAIQKTEQASGFSAAETSAPAATASPSVNAEAATSTTQIAANPASEKIVESEQTETEDVNVSEKEVKNSEQLLKVKTDLQHNILALASVLEKVGNPKAQSSLMKNIEKSFAHLDKKLSKIEKKTQQVKTNDDVTAKAEQQPAPSVVPSPVQITVPSETPSSVPTPVQSPVQSPVVSQVINESVSVQVKQKDSVEEKADHTQKSKDKQDLDKSDQAKEKRNNSQHGSSEKENGNGHDKNKGNNQE
ncbi:hypothetical protein PAECIP111891_02121 [Paenibacillus allorhizoplanae]|uniref:DUF5667 domain-containing protein n=1 Tax=Paenibacillus allorhizoplanae TaxID=2905648 RepID=A0ABN8G7W9_9BACL|nr:DUF5667 domain-containing protein [Paenibacillus allorhizoplanae]CAH1202292.1 hypothetical protein PAECIP111891_02121 [Paenibacillus allorhizoplanae]